MENRDDDFEDRTEQVRHASYSGLGHWLAESCSGLNVDALFLLFSVQIMRQRSLNNTTRYLVDANISSKRKTIDDYGRE